jgi:hypothetical protein
VLTAEQCALIETISVMAQRQRFYHRFIRHGDLPELEVRAVQLRCVNLLLLPTSPTHLCSAVSASLPSPLLTLCCFLTGC